ncbi:LegC family aminotransferase [Alkalihalobacterium bogoriense]|uniref:LegC family aminotransferase n=1 Tax=Alkalihalobacterium bogoriense TaxID=246272 RepID=UPI00047D87D4|nr:LegC family aminotransferase [Alkalihalobacterium bogoriense]
MSQKFIPLSVPNLKGRELEYVTEAIETEWVSTGGRFVDEFEQNIASYVKVKGAVSCQNGTAGLHVALQVCGISMGDEVIVPTMTFVAAVNPVRYLGAEPIFLDCDDSLCLDVEKLRTFCLEECEVVEDKLINKKTKKQIKAVVAVHVFGNMCDMEKLVEIADQFYLKIIEDATEALGTFYTEGTLKGKYAGTIGTAGVYSFNGNKIITTGGGGMIVSNDEQFLKRAKHLTTQAKSDEIYYTHDEVGYNYRMTNLQAAMGLAQLEQLEDFIETKKINYLFYKRELDAVDGLSLLEFRKNIRSNYWFYALFVDNPYPLNRDDLIKHLGERKIQLRPIWDLISYQKPYYMNQTYRIEKAKTYLRHVVNIPCSSNLSKEDVQHVINCLKASGV